jgi:hypothetical protein
MSPSIHLATRSLALVLVLAFLVLSQPSHAAADLRPVPLQSSITQVQPMTGIVLWSTNSQRGSAPIQLEFAYLGYDQVVDAEGHYDWAEVETLLDDVAGRGHQTILRWHDTYVGKPTRVPGSIKALSDYRETLALSEKKETGFPDWSHPELKRFILDFYTRFAERYDQDPRLAFVQTGFGLWAEYHIYDGPMELGKTFPDKAFQAEFARHLTSVFRHTPWMISVDAGNKKHTPFASDTELLALPFGVFDDSFNHANHAKWNEPNWDLFGRERWKIAPAGGEFSFFEKRDQSEALAAQGPHGIPFETQAAKFHISFIIGDDQPRFQPPERLLAAGQACGYRFEVTRFDSGPGSSIVELRNRGIAPLYHDAYPAVNGVRAELSLKGLLPGESRLFPIKAGGEKPSLSIESDRLVPGQRIEFEAALKGAPAAGD